ncbi:5-carboxymethyl-2-hydroxymuconate delta-isomerase [Escherichia coli]|nr:5-carboxymethyl-2-hydroxymuconate delta-isomerase [Escherichia coli]
MPHFIVECSDNIREEADLPGLFAKVNPTLAATGIFPLAGIRSRVHWVDTWQMADGQRDYAFVHMTLKIGAGRSLESRLLALSFEIEELHPTLNFKQNNVHALFK